MKLKEYIKNLLAFADENPDALEMDVIYAKDDEGNGYQGIYYEPSLGYFDEDRDFTPVDSEDFEEYEEEANAVCIN